MFKILFKYILPLVLMLTVFLVGYNYFWGTDAEKQQSRQIYAKFKDLGGDVVNLLRSEKEKYDSGKFDDALAKISSSIKVLKENASSAADGGRELMNKLNQLETQKATIESQIADMKAGNTSSGGMMSSAAPGAEQGNTSSQGNISIDEIGAQIEKLAMQTQQASSQFDQ